MDTQELEQVHVPGLDYSLAFDRKSDFLGKGTVGEVFRAKTKQQPGNGTRIQCYALKIFLDHGERPHFSRECKVLKALALSPHPNILLPLHCWTLNSFQYILFPLATGDLFTFFRKTTQPPLTAQIIHWFVRQLRGLCDALNYIHDYTIPRLNTDDGATMHRIGFHHDIKPVNILLFESGNPAEHLWKLSDFGSGFVSDFTDGDNESVYNSKPSTGDPIYTAPEFALEGRVSRPKDIWSLGCIYLEALIWISDPSQSAIDEFQRERFSLPDGREARKPMYWYQDSDGKVHVHPKVRVKMDALQVLHDGIKPLESTRLLITRMLTVPHRERAIASRLCDQFDIILQNCSTM